MRAIDLEAKARACIKDAFGRLLNEKHLYQSVEVDWRPVWEEAAKDSGPVLGAKRPLTDGEKLTVAEIVKNISSRAWRLESGPGRSIPGLDSADKSILLTWPLVFAFCNSCYQRHPFNPPVYATECGPALVFLGAPDHQAFALPLQCQGCKTMIVVFMVTRQRSKLTLTGRSVIEQVEVPKYIPKAQEGHYSGAIIAHECGQTLAGLFFLRTLVEQHMRSATGSPTLRGDELGDAYNKILAPTLRDSAPSLKEQYAKLSDALHEARADAELFEQTSKQIEGHFEMKSAFDRHARTVP